MFKVQEMFKRMVNECEMFNLIIKRESCLNWKG